MKRDGRKRLSVELDENLDLVMRIAAKKSWMTINTFVHRAIAEKIVKDFGKKALIEGIKKIC